MSDILDFMKDMSYEDRMEITYGLWWDHDAEKTMSYTFKEAWLGPLQVTGCTITDLDWVINSFTKNTIMFLEQKNKTKDTNLCKQGKNDKNKYILGNAQINFFGLQDKLYRNQNYIKYLGFYLITFDNLNWEDGDVYLQKLKFEEYQTNCFKLIPQNKFKITREKFQLLIQKNF